MENQGNVIIYHPRKLFLRLCLAALAIGILLLAYTPTAAHNGGEHPSIVQEIISAQVFTAVLCLLFAWWGLSTQIQLADDTVRFKTMLAVKTVAYQTISRLYIHKLYLGARSGSDVFVTIYAGDTVLRTLKSRYSNRTKAAVVRGIAQHNPDAVIDDTAGLLSKVRPEKQ